MLGNCLGFKKHHFQLKLAVATFWGTFGNKLGYFLFQHQVTLHDSHEIHWMKT